MTVGNRYVCILSSIIVLLSFCFVHATDIYFNVPSGDWDTAANWNPQQVPTSSDNAMIYHGSTVTVSTASSALATSFGFTGGGLGRIVSGALLNSPTIRLGYHGNGSVEQTGGALTCTAFQLGAAPSYDSFYTQVAGHVSCSGTMDLGYSPNGRSEYTQLSGTNSVTTLVIARNNNAQSIYTITGGLLDATNIRFARYGTGPGTMNVSDSADIKVSGSVRLGSDTDAYHGSAYWNQSGGTVVVSGAFNVGYRYGSTGTVMQTGGTLNVNSLEMGQYSGSGYYTLSGGSISSTNALAMGFHTGGYSEFTQNGGIISALKLGMNEQIAATTNLYILTGGNLNVDRIMMGEAAGQSECTIEQSGGIINCDNDLMMGWNVGGVHTFTQSGGTNIVNGDLYLARHNGNTSIYNMTGGRLEVTNGSLRVINRSIATDGSSTGLLHIVGMDPSVSVKVYDQYSDNSTLKLTLDPAHGGVRPIEVTSYIGQLAGTLEIGRLPNIDFEPDMVVTAMTYTANYGGIFTNTNLVDGVGCDVTYDVDIGGGYKAITLSNLTPVIVRGTLVTIR